MMMCSRNLLGDGSLDLLAGGAVGEVVAGPGEVLVGDHAALVGDGFEGERLLADRDWDVFAAVVPAKLIDKEGAQVEAVQVLSDAGAVEGDGHGQFSSGPMRPSEQMIWGSRRSRSP